jgi:hypothetical protein
MYLLNALGSSKDEFSANAVARKPNSNAQAIIAICQGKLTNQQKQSRKKTARIGHSANGPLQKMPTRIFLTITKISPIF